MNKMIAHGVTVQSENDGKLSIVQRMYTPSSYRDLALTLDAEAEKLLLSILLQRSNILFAVQMTEDTHEDGYKTLVEVSTLNPDLSVCNSEGHLFPFYGMSNGDEEMICEAVGDLASDYMQVHFSALAEQRDYMGRQ